MGNYLSIFKIADKLDMIYSVTFEIAGQKMRGKVDAVSVEHAKQKVLSKVIFHEVQRVEQPYQPNTGSKVADFLMGFGKTK